METTGKAGICKILKAGSVNVEAYTTTKVFDELKTEWNGLLKNSVTNTPFSTYEWHKHWWEAYHPGDLWILTFRDEHNCLRGIASFFIKMDDSGHRSVHFVGCEDVTDYLDILVDRDYQQAVYQSLADAFVSHREQFDSLDLCNIPAESPTCSLFPQILAEKGLAVNAQQQEVCPVIPLPDTFDDYLEMLDKKQRKEIQRKLRRAQGQGDSLNWYVVNSDYDINAETEKFLALMTASHPEKAQFLNDQQHQTFFRNIVPAAAEAGWLQLNFLEIAGEAVAAYFNFDYNNHIWVYNSGLEPGKAAALSPGIVLLVYNIEYAIQQGREVFDFLRGDEQYKYRMGGQDTLIYNLKAAWLD